MKSVTLFRWTIAVLFLFANPIFTIAQVWNGSNTVLPATRTGEVGIGLATPTAMLHIRSSDKTGSAFLPNLRLESNFDNAVSGLPETHTWEITTTEAFNFKYLNSNTNLLTFSGTKLDFKGSQLRFGTGEELYTFGVATSPAGNLSHVLTFGGQFIGPYYSFTGNSSNNGGAILQADNQGNFYLINKAASSSNVLTTAQITANTRLFVGGDGNIGIGTTSVGTHEKLAVRGGLITTEGIGNGLSLLGNHLSTLNHFGTTWYGLFLGNPAQLELSTSENKQPVVLSSFYGLGFAVHGGTMALCQNGALVLSADAAAIQSIADLDAANLAYQLYVEKGIRTERARVDLKSNWADYVFEKDYPLLSLSEVERFINSNKHLPNVPSAGEVKEKGIDVAQMDETLLRKIEELTLYAIEQQKELAAMKKQLMELEKALKK